MTSTIPNIELEKIQQPLQAANSDEIDMREVGRALGRHRRVIAGVTGTMVLLSGLYALIKKPVWEGQFQIVLEDKDPTQGGLSRAIANNPMIAQFAGLSAGKSSLETEVKILKSPSVLMPVFQFVKQSRIKKGEDVENFKFTNWVKDQISIELAQGTSVLDIAYQDTDKQLILPVIQKISREYQTYSGKDRERGISQAISYLDKQILKYTTQSVRSLRQAQQFAIDQDLTALKGDGQEDEIRNAINIETIRVQAANEIRNINEQIKQLDAINDDDPETLMYMGAQIPELSSKGLPQTLDRIDTQLALRKAKFTDQDDSIRRLKQRRDVLIQTLRRQTYGYLTAKRSAAQARLTAAERPKGVLIKYRELLRKSARDEATLTQLEAQRQALALEQAREQEPWELISTPTLLDKPVAPKKRQIVGLGLLGGLVLGSGAALVIDRRRGLIFSKDELQQALPCPLLKQLSVADPSSWVEPIELLAAGTLANPRQGAIALIPVGNVPQAQLKQFGRTLQQAIGNRELKITSDLLESRECSHQLLLASPGAANRLQLEHLKMRLALQGKPLAGWVLLDQK